MSQLRILCSLCTDQKKCGAHPVFFEQSQDLGGSERIRTVIDGQPDGAGWSRIFGYDRPELSQGRNQRAKQQEQMRSEQNP